MNNEIEVGSFVRLKQGYIGTVENINDFREPVMKYAVDIQKRDLVFVGDDDIVTHNKIKSEIVEVGDYVNGYLVVEKYIDIDDNGNNFITIEVENDLMLHKSLVEKHIKSIVTKEQYKSVEYVF